ncbi:hypothetical protein GGR53DRAFT_469838 [Hypoxylon sp. FL1150]|nr:hypothetical protein GGR53DRAFT_469838 [Hypoxylon sp. FL1150]
MSGGSTPLALMRLVDFCMNDLPATARAPELDDRNAVSVLKADGDTRTGMDETSGHGIGRDALSRSVLWIGELRGAKSRLATVQIWCKRKRYTMVLNLIMCVRRK